MSKQYYLDVTPDKDGIADLKSGDFLTREDGTNKGIWLRPVTLPSTGWISLEDRKPTAEDADEDGYIIVRCVVGDSRIFKKWENVANKPDRFTHFHPIAKFAPKVPTFGEWINTRLERHLSQFTARELSDFMNESYAEYSRLYGAKEGV